MKKKKKIKNNDMLNNMKFKNTLFKKDKGVALMMILWVMVLLDIIVLQFASSMRTEAKITKNFRDRVEAYYLARAGIEMARFELMYVGSKTKTHGLKDGYVNFRVLDEDIKPLFSREVSLGRGGFYYEYNTIQSKHNLKTLAGNKTELEKVLEYCGVEPLSAEMSQLGSAISDWQDSDHNLSHPDSAEDEWYEENFGYPCRDEKFESVDELKMIRWLRKEDSDSVEERDRKDMILEKLIRLVDVDLINTGGKINENFAPKEVLEASGKTDEQIEVILNDIAERGYHATGRPDIYDVVSNGSVSGSISNRKILAMYKLDKDISLLKWIENFTDNNNKNPFLNDEETE